VKTKTLVTILLGAAIAIVALVPASAHAPGGPHIKSMQYFTDAEARPYKNVFVYVKGEATAVNAIVGNVKEDGRLVDTGRRKDSWFFHGREFIKALQADLHADGVVRALVRAKGEGIPAVVKTCTLVADPDPLFGELAEGDCKQL
jgi:hypothetical protein